MSVVVLRCGRFLTAYRDANASATGALLLTILQGTPRSSGNLRCVSWLLVRYANRWADSVGRLATILFAHLFGISLEADCKKYRFLADIYNDAALMLDMLSPIFPGVVRVTLLCLSGSLRALCGVAGGATKTSLSVHFARTGNVGELNAKVPHLRLKKDVQPVLTGAQDSSQETVISLLGMLVSTIALNPSSSTGLLASTT